jgi:antitoxin component of MazEF toxin-antitoxin module
LIIPKKLLNKLGSAKKFNVQEKDGSLIFVPVKEEKPRENWDQLFAQGKKKGIKPENDPFEIVSNEFDNTEWTW